MPKTIESEIIKIEIDTIPLPKTIELEIIKIEIDGIPSPKTNRKSIVTPAYLCFTSQFRLSITVLLIVIFIKVIQILEVIQTTNFCS